MSKTALSFQLKVEQLAHNIIREELSRRTMGIDFPGRRLRSILAELQRRDLDLAHAQLTHANP
jgi:hypothetical protein